MNDAVPIAILLAIIGALYVRERRSSLKKNWRDFINDRARKH